MSNLFDSTNYPTAIPQVLTAGDYWAWKITTLSDYGSGYTLTYELTPASGGTPITLTASLSGSDYLIEVASATTAGYAAGDYQWVALITRDSDSERAQLDYGTIEVKPNPAISTADTRSHARITLTAIEAVIQGRASIDQMRYTIAGRELEKTPIPDLLLLRDTYRKEVKAEEKAERVRQGMNTGNQIVVRMR